MKKDHSIDMLHGPIAGKLVLMALPIVLSGILQQLFNSADTMVAGRFASSQAMAAVGVTSTIISLVIELFLGISVGANVLVSRYIGKQEPEKVSGAVSTAMGLAAAGGVIMGILGIFLARPLMVLTACPEEILDMAVGYLQIYFIGMPFVMIYNFASALLRAQGDTKRPLLALVVSGIINVCLNLFFVIEFHMAAQGVGLATTISNGVSALLMIVFLVREQGLLHLDLRHIRIVPSEVSQILKVGLPAGIQGAVFAVSNIVIQSAINGFGSAAAAAVSASLNSEYFVFFTVTGFSSAAITFTSQNYAAGRHGRCRRIFIDSLLLSFGIAESMAVVFGFFAAPFIGLFTNDPQVIQFGVPRLLLTTAFEGFVAFYEIPGACMRGMGWSSLPAVESLLGSCVLRLLYLTFLFPGIGTWNSLSIVYPISWTVTSIAMMTSYFLVSRHLFGEGLTRVRRVSRIGRRKNALGFSRA